MDLCEAVYALEASGRSIRIEPFACAGPSCELARPLLIGSDEPHYTASKIYPALLSDQPFLAGFSLICDPRNEMGNEASFDPRIYDVGGMREFIDNYIGLLTAISEYPETGLEILLTSDAP